MRLLFVIFTLFTFTAQSQTDTIFYDEQVREQIGESIKIPIKSRVTNMVDTLFLKQGKWNYVDSLGNLLVEVNFTANRRKQSTHKNGLEIYLNPKNGDTMLMRNYRSGQVIEQLGVKPGILKIENSVYHIYKDFGSYTVAEYRYDYTGTMDFTTMWKSSIEDPEDILNDTNYLKYESEIGDPSLLQPANYNTKAEFNHVSNPEFENHPSAYFSIMSFTNHVTYWSVASISPDLYLSGSGALSGNSFIGIRVFSLKKDIEYIQNTLRQPLKKDSVYCFSA